MYRAVDRGKFHSGQSSNDLFTRSYLHGYGGKGGKGSLMFQTIVTVVRDGHTQSNNGLIGGENGKRATLF